MPILVVGADHPIGIEIIRVLADPEREVRAFVSDPAVGRDLKSQGAKVAIGDLSDEGHVAAAATRCFSIAFVADAISDGRELAFLSAEQVADAWSRAASDANVTRVIWVGSNPPKFTVPQLASVSALEPAEIAQEVARLDDLSDV